VELSRRSTMSGGRAQLRYFSELEHELATIIARRMGVDLGSLPAG
jgi:hypothetical protein